MITVRLAFLLAAMLPAAVAGCRDGGRSPSPEVEAMARPPLTDVIAAHTDSLMRVPGVVGVYEGQLDDGTPCVKVMVLRLDDALRARLPRMLEGHPVVLVETGEIRAMPGEPR
jgi:hypothetical protein